MPLEAFRAAARSLGEDGAEEVVRFRVRATGEERWSAVKATPIHDEDGNVTMAINVIEDISAHKRAELAQRFLARSAEVLASSLDPDEVLVQVANLAVPEVADWVAVDMSPTARSSGWRSRTRPRACASGRSTASVPARPGRAARRLPRAAHRAGGAVPRHPGRAAARGRAGRRALPDPAEFGMRSAMVVPMTARGRTLGTLTFVSGSRAAASTSRTWSWPRSWRRRCATAVDNARLYSERAYIARTLQQSLLPAELPDIPGVEAAARFRPTGEGNEVGWRLLRPVRDRAPRLDHRDGRRVRQGARTPRR